MQGYQLDYGPNEVICREGEPSSDLFFLKEGKLLICSLQGTEVKVIARIEAGEFYGELSFFDGKPRASNIISIESCTIIQIPKQDLTNHLPFWFLETGKSLTKKIRLIDHVISDSHLKRARTEDQRPLSIEEQRQIHALLTQKLG